MDSTVKIDSELLRDKAILERENSFQHFRSIREKADIHIQKGRSISFLEYIQSLDLDPSIFGVVQRKKVDAANFVHFFDIEMKNLDDKNLIDTDKWTIRKRYADFIELDKKITEELAEGVIMPRSQIPQLSQFCNAAAEGIPEIFIEAAEQYLKALISIPRIRARTTILYEFLEISLLKLPQGTQKFKEGYLKKKGGGRFKRNKLKLYCSMFFSSWQERWFILTEEGILYAINSNSTKSRETLLFDQSFQIEYGRKATGSQTGISLLTSNRRLNLQAKDVFETLDWVGEIQKAAKASPYTKINRFLSFAPVRDPNHYCKWYVDADGYFEDLYEALMQAKREVFITDWWLTPEIYLKRPIQEGNEDFRLDRVLGKLANNGVKVYVIVYHEVKMVMYNDSEHTKRALEALSSNVTVLKHPSEPFFSWSHHEKLVVIDQSLGFIGGLDLCFGRLDSSDHPLKDPAFEDGKGETFPGQDYANPRLVDFRNVRQHDISLIDKSSVPRMPFHDAMMKVVGPVVGDMCRHFIQYWNHVEIDCYGKEGEAPMPQTALVAAEEEANLRRENTIVKFKSAFRKIVGMRHLAEQFGTSPTHNENAPVPSFEEKPASKLSFKRTQSTLPSIGGVDSSRGSRDHLRDEIQTIIHSKKHDVVGSEEIKEEEELNDSFNMSIDEGLKAKLRMKYQKSGPFPEPEKHVLKKDDENIEEKPASKILHGMKLKGLSIFNQMSQKNVRIPNSRQVRTMHAIGQPHRFMPGSQDEKEYNQRYADLLKNIRKKEKDYQDEVQQRSSQKMKRLPTLSTLTNIILPPKSEHEKLHSKLSDNFFEKNMLQLLFNPKEKKIEGTCTCQMLRSASKWSLGLNSNDGNVENSIQNAYIELIQNSKRFIYIENQFFMSGTAGKVIQNEVAQAIVYRIEKAHARHEKFRVMVFLPLLPAFEGEIIDSKAALLRIQIHWQYMTICRGGESIYEQLRNKGIPPEDYIQFYSLRTHTKMPNGEPVSEMIYIHSKILIVDDEIVLIGSANINDRSLQGSRDSEIAMIVEDNKKVDSIMDGEEVQVNEFAHSFRKRLLAEHLGFSEDEVEDPISEEFTNTMNEIAERNTLIYREVFACYPDDTQKTLKDIDEFAKTKNLDKYDEVSHKIQGHLVWYPLDFLSEEQLTAPMSSMEYYIPDQTFV